MIDGVKLMDHVDEDHTEVKMEKLVDNLEVDHGKEKLVDLEVDHLEVKMIKLVEMWGKMKQGDNIKLRVKVVCPVCPDQVQSSFASGNVLIKITIPTLPIISIFETIDKSLNAIFL